MSFSTCCSLVLYVCIHSINCSLPNHQSIIQPPPRSLLFAHPWPQQPLECAAQDPTAAVQRARLLDGCCGQGECTTNKIDCNIVTAPTPFISLLNTRKSVTHSHVHASIHFPTHSPTSTHPLLSAEFPARFASRGRLPSLVDRPDSAHSHLQVRPVKSWPIETTPGYNAHPGCILPGVQAVRGHHRVHGPTKAGKLAARHPEGEKALRLRFPGQSGALLVRKRRQQKILRWAMGVCGQG